MFLDMSRAVLKSTSSFCITRLICKQWNFSCANYVNLFMSWLLNLLL